METGNVQANGNERVKIHRRLSSVFIPPQPPILERTAAVVSDAVKPVSTKLGLRSVTLANEREVVSNCRCSTTIFRYHLFNYRNYNGNKISTAKYSLLTFIPKNLWEQFHRIANLYFVLIASMNWIPALQAFNRYIGMIPVLLILFLTACKDAYEDFRRRRLDKQINCSYCHVWDSDKGRFRKMQWQHVIVGDFVHLSLDEVIPADILLIRSSDSNGLCFVETSNLDGETSLKQRRVPVLVLPFSGEDSQFKPPQFKATIACEQPNNLVYQMQGRIQYEDGQMESIYPENMLLRGCKIRNTTFVEGMVLYAGNDTKAMMNNCGVRYKRSSLELITNRFIIYCVLILIAMCLFDGIASMIWLHSFSVNNLHEISFICLNSGSPIIEGILNCLTAILNYQILIPLSLYISVELVKLGQIYFISMDMNMYDEKSDRRMECRSLNIPEELGQIQYVLSDKTGTLTENRMVFRRCAIGGIDYGSDIDSHAQPPEINVKNVVVDEALKQQVQAEWDSNQELLDFFITMAVCNTVVVNKVPRVDSLEIGFFENDAFTTGNSTFFYPLQDPNYPTYSATCCDQATKTERSAQCELEKETIGEMSTDSLNWDASTPTSTRSATSTFSRSSNIRERMRTFHNDLVMLRNRLIHGQQRRRCKGGDKNAEKLSDSLYEGESPDELALVYAAKAYGITLIGRTAESVAISLPDRNRQILEILKILPFDSARKRMSVIVRREEEVIVYCKGADTEVLNSLSRSFVDSTYGNAVLRNSTSHLDRFSAQGLRTLCLAKRTLSLSEYEEWLCRHIEIEGDIGSEHRDERLARSINEIEKNFSLLGVTAIEDRLQEGVPETIDVLREAGIQIWLLTGDKMETAVNIARSCGLFPSNSSVFVIDTEGDIETAYLHSLQNSTQPEHNERKPYCVVLSSKSLHLLEQSHQLLLDVLRRSLSVLCYRMTPSNKAEIAKMVKKALNGKILAIGDGANDVPMIQCADVGVGISGQEGMQAVMASDFSIARFRHLRELLLVHGHWCYDRLARTFLYFLYKNASFVFVLFWCQLFSGFSGEAPMDQIYMMTYPIIFTGVQPLAFGIYEQIATRKILYTKPKLYEVGRAGKSYKGSYFWLNILDAIWQSAVIYFIAHFTYLDSTAGYHTFGFLLASSIFLVNNVHLAIEVHYWTLQTLMLFLFFILVHYAYFLVEDVLVSPSWHLKDTPVYVAQHALITSEYWGALLLTIFIATMPRFFIYTFLNAFRPSSVFVECRRLPTKSSDCNSILCTRL